MIKHQQPSVEIISRFVFSSEGFLEQLGVIAPQTCVKSLDRKLKLNGKHWLLEVGPLDEFKSGGTNNVLKI